MCLCKKICFAYNDIKSKLGISHIIHNKLLKANSYNNDQSSISLVSTKFKHNIDRIFVFIISVLYRIPTRLYCKMVHELIPDFSAGPLDRYRNNATFNWKKLKVFLETEEIVQFKVNRKIVIL